jgi:hypothetical protein
MTDADDTDRPTADSDGIDAALERLLAGDDPAPQAPDWARNVALLVRAAQAPPRPDELAGEADVVRRMRDVRLAALAGEPTADDLEPLASVTQLGDRLSRRGHDRNYRAKHAAARLEASRHPAVRTLGRVIAMKAAAVTTVAVIGVAAAAAATTGIVATVVVPAFSGDEPSKPARPPATTARPERPGTTQGGGADAPASADELLPQVACPLLSACPAPLPPARPPQGTASTTTVPASTTATTVAGDAEATPETTTTVPDSATTTTVPEPTTTVPEPPTTTIPETPPDPLVTPLSEGFSPSL